MSLTAKRTPPFSGETATDSIGAILHREPEWSLLPPSVPPRIRELLASPETMARMGRAARARAEALFSLRTNVATLAGLFADPSRREPARLQEAV